MWRAFVKTVKVCGTKAETTLETRGSARLKDSSKIEAWWGTKRTPDWRLTSSYNVSKAWPRPTFAVL